jgi:hypothetical protein
MTMKNYAFLFKPLFFIFNLVFATWLVLAIERLKPSDFGSYRSVFEPPQKPKTVSKADKPFLKKLITDYKTGKIDSAALEEQLNRFLEAPGPNTTK